MIIICVYDSHYFFYVSNFIPSGFFKSSFEISVRSSHSFHVEFFCSSHILASFYVMYFGFLYLLFNMLFNFLLILKYIFIFLFSYTLFLDLLFHISNHYPFIWFFCFYFLKLKLIGFCFYVFLLFSGLFSC